MHSEPPPLPVPCPYAAPVVLGVKGMELLAAPVDDADDPRSEFAAPPRC